MELALPAGVLPATGSSAETSHANDPRKWWALSVLLLAQLMIILDIAIVNIAVPSAQADLHIAPSHVQWVVTAYLLPFGSLLLLGGRIADYTGRKRAFCIAAVGFAVASAFGGAATTEGVLFGARAFQGLFAAAMAPALLSMLTLGFPRGPDRSRALSLFGGVSAAGGALGVVIGGLLTEYLSWRWSLLINVPLSGLVVVGAIPLLRESRAGATPHYDAGGAALATAGLLAIIYGIANVGQNGWGDALTVGPLVAGLAVLAAFVAWESTTTHPLLPLAILRDRTRGGAFLTCAISYGPPTALMLLTLIFLQGPLRESPLSAGLHFLPIPIFAIAGALASRWLLTLVRPRTLLLAGFTSLAAGMLAMTRVGLDASFVRDMVPAFALLGLGASVLFVTANTLALSGIPDDDSGLASAVINTMQQVGAAVGVAILSSVASQASADYLLGHGPASAPQALVHGNNRAFVIGAALMLAVGIIAAWLVDAPRDR
jgi:EmrB/QacA subfamily drug resistance transporter